MHVGIHGNFTLLLFSSFHQVSGHFTYGVMAISAATFMFWSMFGTHILPAALNLGNPVSLALQLSCSVLVSNKPFIRALHSSHGYHVTYLPMFGPFVL